jgi:Cu/Zn superoxide dismutase
MKILYSAMAVAAAAALAAPALATSNSMQNMHNAMSSKVLNINLGQQNNSNQNGIATVKDVSGGVLVKVSVQNEPKGASEPSHIHPGTCAKLNPAPWKVLNNVVNGTAVTTVKGITVADLKKSQYAINVHDGSNYTRYVSCGDL